MPSERETPLLIYATEAPRAWMEHEFKLAGYEVVTVNNGLVALDQAVRTPPALIVADAQLQGVPGEDMCRILKGLKSMPPAPIILLQADYDSQFDAGLRAGADDVWLMPQNPPELHARLHLLRTHLERLGALRLERDHCWDLAHHDHLTGLPNRRLLDRAMNEALVDMRAQGAMFSILLFDIDRFKSINDRWGHGTGDRVLKEIANVLRRTSRRHDVIGRHGGEEFLYLLPGHSLDDAVRQAERVRSELAAHPFETSDEAILLTVSVGATEADAADNSETLLERADNLLYEAKRTGRNRIVSWLR